jgi:hypothetical protein
METFAPGDRVVAINTDMSAPIYPNGDRSQHPFQFPDGPLRRGVIFHVASVKALSTGRQGVFLTGIRVMWGSEEIPWASTRFRKVDTLRDHVPQKRRRKQPVAPQDPGKSLNISS